MSRQSTSQILVPTAAAALVLLLGAGPAAARQDSGIATGSLTGQAAAHCSLQRVGGQYVRCDDLTGNGVTAPGWVSARG